MVIKSISTVNVYIDESWNIEIANESFNAFMVFIVPTKIKMMQAEFKSFNSTSRVHPLVYRPLSLLKNEIVNLRREYCLLKKKFHFKNLSGSQFTKVEQCVKQLLELTIDALRSKNPDNFQYPVQCKFAVLYYKNPDRKRLKTYYGRHAREQEKQKVRFYETILRFLFKFALNSLYDDEHHVRLEAIYYDGTPYSRPLDGKKIIRLMQLRGSPLRAWVKVSDNVHINHLKSDCSKYSLEEEAYCHANMLQVADLLLGSINHALKKLSSSSFQVNDLRNLDWNRPFSQLRAQEGNVSKKEYFGMFLLTELLKKPLIRRSGFQNSRHYKSFAISLASLVNDDWQFKDFLTTLFRQSDDNDSIGQTTLTSFFIKK